MLTALFSAISGLNANGTSLSVIGDNIANMNTVGYKSSRVAFGDVLSQTITGTSGNSQIGRGVIVSDISPLFTQGSFETTASALDMAIDGDGFFMVKENNSNFYTRAGQFTLDKAGDLVTPDNLKVQGYLYDSGGNATGVVGDISVASLNSAPHPTANAEFSVNLDSRDSVTGPFDPTNTSGTSNFSTSMTVYDSLGNDHLLTTYFTKTAANQWEANVVTVTDPATDPPTYSVIGTQALQFDENGNLTTPDPPEFTDTFDFSPWGADSAQNVKFDITGMSQYGADSATVFLSQDGFTSGSLKTLSVSEDGTITGIFTNGQTKPVARLALAKFTAPTELTKIGRNLYAESFSSGQPIIGEPGTAGIGRVLSSSLELSNVDLAEEFIKMIAAQRGFQANSRVITTTDDLLQEVVNLKR
ncbi:Flagellar hook protein FlgE [hydrothermal vent metagenome]|uniref:Flagellar hook protein FlgE n=1 Tax=hydrothermal vent metagenome TaxID=652676 RepID=A0A3B1DY26_9ZZZZ